MDVALRLLFAAATLPPPPEPDTATGNGGLPRALVVAAGLALTVLVAAVTALLIGRLRADRLDRRPSLAAHRVEWWCDGEAVVLGYAGDPAGDPTFADHLARLRADGRRGALVLIEPVSDAIVALCPIQQEEAKPVHPADRQDPRWAAVRRPSQTIGLDQ